MPSATKTPFVIVSGNIAAGKSTMVDAIAHALTVPAYHERPERNPFFGPPHAQALQSELWFLLDAVRAHRAVQAGGGGGVQERSVREHYAVFAQARHRHGWLSQAEVELIGEVDDSVVSDLRPPDLLLFLHADVDSLSARIDARGRPEELALPRQYLETLSALYEEFIKSWAESPLRRLDTTTVDVRSEQGMSSVLEVTREALT